MFQIDEGKPAEHKVMLASTVYDSPSPEYTYSIQKSREALHEAGIGTAYLLLSGNCHVDDARNLVARSFLDSDCDDLVFLDADVSWEAQDLVRLCQHEADIVGGVYPYRRQDKPDELPARLIPGAEVVDGLVEVEGLPTGFMRIRREVFEAIKPHVGSFPHEGSTLWLFFERTLEDGTRWGGDLNFCRRWRKTGGKIHADYEVVLGHVAKILVKGSLGSQLRRRERRTLRYVTGKIKAGKATIRDYQEAIDYVGNTYGAPLEALAACVGYARKADGPILEAGSGLSTILMAAACPHTVFCLEHSAVHIAQLKQMAYDTGLENIGLCVVPVRGGWYDVSDFKGLPDRFSFGFNDGPPRQIGSRDGYFKQFGDRVDQFLVDDMDDPIYRDYVMSWAKETGREVVSISNRVAVCQQPETSSRARCA